jgi:predicted transcriptional regulator
MKPMVYTLLTVKVPKDTFKKFKHTAVEREISLSDVIRQAIDKFINNEVEA